MTGKISKEVRELLRTTPDGMTTAQLVAALDKTKDKWAFSKRLGDSLRAMPDIYIDRWVPGKRGHWAAVWCVVVPPENCPKPARKCNDHLI